MEAPTPGPHTNLYAEARNRLATKLSTRTCARCGEPITPGTTYTNAGVSTRHPTLTRRDGEPKILEGYGAGAGGACWDAEHVGPATHLPA